MDDVCQDSAGDSSTKSGGALRSRFDHGFSYSYTTVGQKLDFAYIESFEANGRWVARPRAYGDGRGDLQVIPNAAIDDTSTKRERVG